MKVLQDAIRHIRNLAKFNALRALGLAGEHERHSVGRNRLILGRALRTR